MLKFKRLTAMVIGGVMMFAGCTAAQPTAPTATPQQTATATVAPPPTSAPAAATATPAPEPTAEPKLSAQPRKLTVLLSDSPSQPLQDNALAQQAIFEKTNIQLEYQIVPSSSYNDKKSALMATNQLPDISFLNNNNITTNAHTGVFLNLTEYIDDMPSFKRFWDSIPDMKKGMVGGELFGFQMVARNETANGFGPVIRTDLLEKHNIPVPTTYDELLDVLKQLKAEYPTSRPYTVRNGATLQHFKTQAYALGSGFGSNGLYFDHDLDKYVFGPATQEFKTVLQFFADAYAAGVFDPDYATTTSEQFQSRMISGESFFFFDNSGFSIDYTNNLQKAIPEGTLECIPYLTNTYGQRRAMAYATTLNDRFYVLRADIKDPDTVIKFMDWMYSDEGSDITNYGKEGVSFRYNSAGKPEFIPEYVMKFKDQSPVYYAVFSDAGITKLNFCLYAGNTEQSFAIQKIAGIWNDFADKYWALAAAENDPVKGALRQPVTSPALDAADAERVKEITLDLTTFLEQEYNKYIMGTEPISKWDTVIEEAIKRGANELADIHNKADEAYK